MTPLAEAARSGDAAVFQLLIDRGADVNIAGVAGARARGALDVRCVRRAVCSSR